MIFLAHQHSNATGHKTYVESYTLPPSPTNAVNLNWQSELPKF